MRCWKCGFVMSEDEEICTRCGSDLEKIVCRSCGKQIFPESNFCMFCGNDIRNIATEDTREIVFQKFEFVSDEEKTQTIQKRIQASERGKRTENKQQFSLAMANGIMTVIYPLKKIDVNFQEEFVRIIKTKSKTEEKREILYKNICGIEYFTRISPLYMTLFVVILLLLIYMFVSGAIGIGGTLAIFELFVFLCWNFSFQICHFDLIITEKSGKHTVISAKKQKILLEIMDMIQTQADLLSKENIKKASVLTKNEVYYGNQFRFCEHGLKCNFHWFAFFFGPFFCFYRSGGKLFREFFQIFFVLLVVTTLGFSFSLKSFANAWNDGFALWMNVCWIWFGILSIYGIYCAIRCGKEFNQYYFRYCNMLAGQEKSKNGCNEASRKKAIFAVILYGILMGVLVTGISKGMSSAILADASQQAANDTNTEIPTDVKHESRDFKNLCSLI